MIEFLKKYRILIVFVLLLGVVLFWYFKIKRNAPVPEAPRPAFVLERTLPMQGTFQAAFPTTAISFYFSLPVDKSKILVKIEPSTDYEFTTDSTAKVVSVRPVPSWKFGVAYKITLAASSRDGQEISPIEYSFALEVPKDSPMTK